MYFLSVENATPRVTNIFLQTATSTFLQINFCCSGDDQHCHSDCLPEIGSTSSTKHTKSIDQTFKSTCREQPVHEGF